MVRFKNRYLVLELIWKDSKTNEPLDERALVNVFRESVQLNFGDHGLGQCYGSLQVKYMSPLTNTCVVRCSRDHYQQVWCAITLLTEINQRPVLLRLLKLSGTIRECRQAALEHVCRKLKDLEPRLKAEYGRCVETAKQKISAIEL
mmetsp:Transcript_31671/g.69216  ORF Transcript_31671/g.69216 Transcript_31671/m.69216 type:complete len:146 (-) Transcript_31671:458-895(-)|eukprot:CAMPEP_0118924130 /NCGR_PEP_ID=MMETSP1169-20130426/2408_1 /TAXON_ID=36882 /ORGANISM="Pyramimonas obovata, Strain CCMP722" /LENGTH=145 /DNA_ID=CAMNT_0006865217 /DNA_START=96 /DNA_END=533 /DNA_ORIENTATION=+